MSNSSKRNYLSVVKDSSESGSNSSSGGGGELLPGQILAPEDFTPEISSQVQKAIKNSGLKGVVTGALVGNDISQDIRPLILYDGRVQLLRYSDHLVSYNSESLSGYHSQLEKLVKLSFVTSYGEHAGQIWVLRPFYKTTLNNTDEVLTITIVESIIQQIKQLHKSGIIHGHLCASNIGLEGGAIRLMDIGFSSLSSNAKSLSADLAPEIQGGFPATISTDVYGLGTILEYIFGTGTSPSSFYAFINSVVSKDPARRPTIQWVEENLKTKTSGIIGSNQDTPLKIPSAAQATKNKDYNSGEKPAIKLPNYFLPIVGVLIAAVLFFGYRHYFQERETYEDQDSVNYQSYWDSGDKDLMKAVAVAAVKQGSESARYVINKFAFKGKNENGVLSTVIKTALNPAWERELSDEDLQVIYRIGLGALLPKELHQTNFTKDTHPAVILALVGALDIDSPGNEFSAFKVSHLVKLPDPYGRIFSDLNKLGVTDVESKIVKALSHIATGNISNHAIETFLLTDFESPDKADTSAVMIEAKVKIMLPLIMSSEEAPLAVIEILSNKENPKKRLFEWFAANELGIWKNISTGDKLSLLAGVVPETLTFEQKVDLLGIENEPSLRKSSAEVLLGDSSIQDLHPVINIVVQFPGSFTRSQSISLLSALKVKSDKGYQFLNQWFSTNPNPQIIIKILSTRRKTSEVDGFVFEGSRYLSSSSRKVVLQPEELIAFSTHPEPILRAMAYSQLDASIPEHREVIKNAIKIEQNQRLRNDLQERLNLYLPAKEE